ncbi:MAG: peptide-methionine (S)-S-oxide reductase MsrA [Methanospirillaceae archaeon]|nr:peptide-methionine (S)-S-oxide reductase MsrA [Methanospirillaceae archaeon]
MALATVAGGCFWGIEAAYAEIPGVIQTRVGYSGGTTVHPTYQDVCRGDTGHVEAVEITFDPEKVSYKKILEIFFAVHDPTTADRQGNDVGPQYRSVIFYHDEEQQKTATAFIKNCNESGLYLSPVITEVRRAGNFYDAEEYHQQFFAKMRNRYEHIQWG